MSKKFIGIGVSPGVSIAPVFKIEKVESSEDLEVTWQEIAQALEKSAQYLEDKAKNIDLIKGVFNFQQASIILGKFLIRS